MRNSITPTPTHLVIEPVGLDRLWSFTSSLSIPWAHVRGATHDPGVRDEPKGWRGPGLRTGSKLGGTFHADTRKRLSNVDGFKSFVAQ